MTLAVILLISISWAASPTTADMRPSGQSAPPTGSATTQDQGASQPQTPSKQSAPSTTSPKPSAAKPHSTTKRSLHKKRAVQSDCDATPAPAHAGAVASDPAPAAPEETSAGASPPAQNAPTPAPSKNCPPPKIIVRQGGITEPSIQLAGGPGGNDASQKRDATNQMLSQAEANLKQVAGQQLNSTQQDSVTQIRQFMEQSKSALAAGDMERARTLAWKAKLLSDDLVKPQK